MSLPVVKPTVVSVFCGCGGSSLGYRMAGFKELLAIDYSELPVETFKANFPEVPVWLRNVEDCTGKEIMDFCKLKPGKLDVLDGSPPCQSFSTVGAIKGKRKISDPRNSLFKEFIRLIGEIKPMVFLMENVPGMAQGTYRGVFNVILKTLKETGYNVKCKKLNAKNYGVAQARKRLFYIGVRDGDPVFPKPQGKIVTVKEVIDKLVNKEKDTPKLSKKYLPMWKKIKPGYGEGSIIAKADRKAGDNMNCYKVHPGRPAGTIRTVQCTGWATMVHYREPRPLTTMEAQRLSSFPEGFKVLGNYKQRWKQIGNSVMPLQMKAIAETIKEKILGGAKK